MSTILIVEDDLALNQGISFNFKMDGLQTVSAHTLQEAEIFLKQEKIDLVILDVNLPDGSGFDFCKKVRLSIDCPILFLTACDLEFEIITGFKMGGDDYVTKPFSLNILRERVFSLLRRAQKNNQVPLEFEVDGFIFNLQKLTVTRGEESLELSPIEYKLLKTLAEQKGNILTRQKLIDELWDGDQFIEEHALTVHINRLRNKIEANPSKPTYIKTVYGKGYMWGGGES